MAYEINFTKTSIAELGPAMKQYEVRDIRTPGLQVVVYPTGAKTFMFCKKKMGRNIKIKIGRATDVSVETARKQADILRIQVDQNDYLDESLQEKLPEPTFNELYQRYYNEYALLHTKRPNDLRKLLNLHIMPRIGNNKYSSITKARMKEIHREIAETCGRYTSNRAVAMVRAVFNFGLNEEIIKGENPCVGVKLFKQRKRDRFLSRKELELFFDALSFVDKIYQDFFRLALFVGARKATLLAMRYDEIDFDLKQWRLSEDKSKNNDINFYVLPDLAIEIILERKAMNEKLDKPSNFVFPGDGPKGHLVEPKKAFRKIKWLMGVADITIHDLRRTLASYMAISNTSLPIIGKALNHKSQASTEIYARLSHEPVRQAVSSAVDSMMQKKPKQTFYGEFYSQVVNFNIQTFNNLRPCFMNLSYC